jgi:hypothetical protein
MVPRKIARCFRKRIYNPKRWNTPNQKRIAYKGTAAARKVMNLPVAPG